MSEESSTDLFAHRGKAGKGVVKVNKAVREQDQAIDPGYVVPGKDLQEIIDILEAGNHATVNDMAKELHSTILSQLRRREWWTCHVGGYLFHGLEATETGIRNWSAKHVHPSSGVRFAKITPPGVFEAAWEEALEASAKDEAKILFMQDGCPECSHPAWRHMTPLTGWPKQGQKNSTGRCDHPSPQPRAKNSTAKGKATCGCDYAVRNRISA